MRGTRAGRLPAAVTVPSVMRRRSRAERRYEKLSYKNFLSRLQYSPMSLLSPAAIRSSHSRLSAAHDARQHTATNRPDSGLLSQHCHTSSASASSSSILSSCPLCLLLILVHPAYTQVHVCLDVVLHIGCTQHSRPDGPPLISTHQPGPRPRHACASPHSSSLLYFMLRHHTRR